MDTNFPNQDGGFFKGYTRKVVDRMYAQHAAWAELANAADSRVRPESLAVSTQTEVGLLEEVNDNPQNQD